MTKKLYLPFLMAMIVALMTSCSKKMGELSSDYFTVTPQVLEAVGGKVPATINGKFPEKYFNKKAVVEVTPVLKWNGGEAKGQSAVFQGEKVEGNDQTISYKMGGSYTMKTSFDYVPEMAKSELYLEFKATVGKKTVTIPAVKVADGVISTSEMLEQTLGSANPANGDDAFQRIIKEKQGNSIMAYDGCMNLFAGPTDMQFSSMINLYDCHYSRSKIIGSTGGTIDDMKEAIEKEAQGLIKSAVMITHVGGLDSVVETTKNLPDVPGGKKLVYTHINMPMTAIDDFAKLGEQDPFFKELDAVCKKNRGLWSAEAEKMLLEHFR